MKRQSGVTASLQYGYYGMTLETNSLLRLFSSDGVQLVVGQDTQHFYVALVTVPLNRLGVLSQIPVQGLQPEQKQAEVDESLLHSGSTSKPLSLKQVKAVCLAFERKIGAMKTSVLGTSTPGSLAIALVDILIELHLN